MTHKESEFFIDKETKSCLKMIARLIHSVKVDGADKNKPDRTIVNKIVNQLKIAYKMGYEDGHEEGYRDCMEDESP